MNPAINEKVIHLTHEKLSKLIGKNGDNKKLIEKVCELTIAIPHNRSFEMSEEAKFDVILRSKSDAKDFADIEWAENVYRHVKSATRGGFVKKMTKEEYDFLADRKDGEILDDNALKILENRYNVEVVYVNFEGLVYVCVLERMGVHRIFGDLERAIEVVGDFVHARYRRDPPLTSKNRIIRKEAKLRDAKRAKKRF
jgi:hypothetical protein